MAVLEPPARPVIARFARAEATPRRRLWVDRSMRGLVTAGGLAIIASVLGILVFIVVEVVPLLGRPRVTVEAVRPFAGSLAGGEATAAPGVATHAVVGDEYRTHLAALGGDGLVRTFRIADGSLVDSTSLVAAGLTVELPLTANPAGSSLLAGASRDGRVVVVPMHFDVTFDASSRRQVSPRVGRPAWLTLDPAGGAIAAFAAHADDEGRVTAAAQLAAGGVAVVRRDARTNMMTGETTFDESRFTTAVRGRVTAMVVDHDQRNLYAGTAEGTLVWWQLGVGPDGEPGEPQVVNAGAPISALSLLIGDRSLVVGQANGALSVWFPVRQPGEAEDLLLTRVRDLESLSGPIDVLSPSLRNKAFLAQDRNDRMALYYSTSERTLWSGASPLQGTTAATFSPKADGAFFLGPGGVASVEIDNPHPEVSWKALFGRVWYEGYEEPRYVWQSTGGTDDFESKLGLTPLIVGTLKGTVYSLLIAIPLGVLGAMYASQFMHPKVLRLVKPTVEIMAALPSVVLGFLAGLWLAPRVEKGFPALILAFVLVPLFTLAAGAAWNALPRAFRGRFPAGVEVFWYGAVILGAIALCIQLGGPFADFAFGGSFQEWLLRTTGLPYDQRNAVVVGLAMGFAVIPIIFAISEDAFTNVPKNLIAASLALGANRWQTVTRVVLPTASPGIFSAIMIGFGRAVGETMIVLMATGNTPIMELNPFNGFRTLSANIAVEIPEAPVGGTLYRVLFLAALLLFLMTFLVNTVAELVRQRLRRKFAQL